MSKLIFFACNHTLQTKRFSLLGPQHKDNLQLSLLGQLRASMIMEKMDTATQVSFRYVNSGIATKEGLSDAKINIARFYMLRNKPDSAWADFNYLLKENKEKYFLYNLMLYYCISIFNHHIFFGPKFYIAFLK